MDEEIQDTGTAGPSTAQSGLEEEQKKTHVVNGLGLG